MAYCLKWLFDSDQNGGLRGGCFDVSKPENCWVGLDDGNMSVAGGSIGFLVEESHGGWASQGPELLTNGSFDDGLTGWTDNSVGTGAISASGGQLTITNADISNYGVCSQSFTLEVGEWYVLRIDNAGGSPGSLYSQVVAAGWSKNQSPNTTSTFFMKATSASATLNLQIPGNAAGTTIVNSVSIRKLPGNHLWQTTTGKKPLLQVDSKGRRYIDWDSTNDQLDMVEGGNGNVWGFANEYHYVGFANEPNTNGITTLMILNDSDVGGWAGAAQNGAGTSGGSGTQVRLFTEHTPDGHPAADFDLRQELWDILQVTDGGAQTWIWEISGLGITNFTNDNIVGFNGYSSWTYNDTNAFFLAAGRQMTDEEIKLAMSWLKLRRGGEMAWD